MTDEPKAPMRKPGFVIFVAILQFFSSAMFFGFGLIAALGIFFGASWGIDDYVSREMSRFSSTPNFSYGLTLIFSVALAICLFMAIFYLALGVGLLKGKKAAWYFQIVASTLGLLTTPFGFMWGFPVLPFGSLLNVAILVVFFQNKNRDFFGV